MKWNPEKIKMLIEGSKEAVPRLEAMQKAKGINAENPSVTVTKAFCQYLENILKAPEEEKPIVYQQYSVWPELIYAFDLQPICMEATSGLTLAINPMDPKGLAKYIDIAQDGGIPRDLCSVNKVGIGEILLKTLPPPKFVLCHTQACDSGRSTFQVIQDITGAPLFFLDSPYGEGEEEIAYMARQIKAMISFIEEQTGRKLDWDRAKEVIEESNRMVEYWLEWNELRKLIPCPAESMQGGITFVTSAALSGHPQGTAVMKALRDEAVERVERGLRVVPEEKIRASWFHMHVLWDLSYLNYLQEQYGAVSVIQLVSYYAANRPIDTSSPERMIRGLAERYLMSLPMARQGRGAADIWLDDLLYTAKEWKADCIILASHNGCKYLKASYAMARDECHKAGIPIMMFDVDMEDPRVVSKEGYRKKVEDFLNLIVLPAKDRQSRDGKE